MESHGDADRLILQRPEDIDLKRIDAIIAGGGVGEDAVRMLARNDLLGPGRFGKMFPDLEAFRPPDEALENLGLEMREPAPGDPALNNLEIPAGFTYLGQFIDHDLTFDQTAGFPEIDDPDEIAQARTPSLDLDSLYGTGPRRQPELYDRSTPLSRAAFRIGPTSPIPSSGGIGQPDLPVSLPNDLPRRPNKVAIIADPRNDENLVVAQTHLAFLKFHNRVLSSLPLSAQSRGDDRQAAFTQAEEDRATTPFHRARRLVRWHYQWVVLHDFLPRLVDPAVLGDVLANGRRFYDFDRDPFDGRPFMPLEFSVAAYRVGHSMVREAYNHNRVFADQAVEPTAFTEATLFLLFSFTGKGGFPAPPGTHPTLPSNWIIDWRRFFDVGQPELLNFTRRLDTTLIPQLQNLPVPAQQTGPRSLAVRNLLRGSRLGLPAGQDVAAFMSATPLTPAEVASGSDEAILRQHGFHERTPLWYYILKEAKVQAGGTRLGEVGSRIVAEVFVGLLEGDRNSFLSKDPDWKPTLPAATAGAFTMADLLRFVNDLNPVG